jgi:DNA-binding NtrC family response regulator
VGRNLAPAARVTLVADRFLVEDSRTIDLASGDAVQFVTSTAGGPSEQARWLARCDRFYTLRHPAFASLIDYGLFGECQRFEAWQVGDLANSPPGAVVSAASEFLAAVGLTPLAQEPLALRRARDGRLVLVPDAACGYESPGSPAAARPVALAACGLRVVHRPAVSRIADHLCELCEAKPRILALWGASGSGIRTAVRELARAARLQGFVPLAAPLTTIPAAQVLRAVADRSLFLLHTRTRQAESPEEGWRALLSRVMEGRRGHVLLFAGRTEVPRVAGLHLAPLTDLQLIDSIEPARVDDRSRRRIVVAARRAQGLPGRFVEQLWKPMATEQTYSMAGRGSLANRVAESQPAYGADASPDVSVDASSGHGLVMWPSSDNGALGQRLDEAVGWLRAGRRAAGERVLRQTTGALARRHEWPEAARGACALGRALLARGRAVEAGTVLDLARAYLQHTRGITPVWLEITALIGHQAIDVGRFDEADSVLLAGLDAARSMSCREQDVELRLGLARCCFWRGRFDEAHRMLQAIEAEALPATAAIRVHAARARVAVGQRQLEGAVTHATAAVAASQSGADAAAAARAAIALAFAHLAVGDLESVQRDVAGGLAVPRPARGPLVTIKLRLLEAEATRRQGLSSRAAALFRQVERLGRTKLPFTIQARVKLLGALLGGMSALEAVRRSPCAQALSLFAPAARAFAARDQLPLEDVVEILRCCQVADEEGAVLRTVCQTLRKRLSAAAVGFVSHDAALMVSDGARIDRRMAERVLAMGETIPPHAWDGYVEGGAPVRYGGGSIAAVVARWALGTHVDAPLVAAALTLGATAAGPLVAEVLARSRQRREAESGSRMRTEILGDSRRMDEVRQMIERAAGAPFPVLVEGESGSGKELVARAIHRRSPRRDRPFCSMNCAALPDDLVESELFGHARGAFTGAIAERPGVFEEAHTGTLFLDEIGELSMRAQAKVLRTIQEGELRRVGENASRRVDVRIVAATNRDLRQEVAAGRFRLDLLYRLDVLRIVVPPLRERAEDIALLADIFWQEATSRIGSKAVLGAPAVAALAQYGWPGNVRELQNVLAATAVRSPRRGIVPATALPPPFHQSSSTDTWRLDEARRGFEERFIRAALVRCGGRRSRAAIELGITRQGLTKLMARLRIDAP